MKVINIDLPKKTTEVILLFHFAYGYINENDKDFGLAHITEHYITALLEKIYPVKYI
jgi:hypothetical protein